MILSILFVLLTAVYLTLLEFSKNTWPGWLFAVATCVLVLLLHHFHKAKPPLLFLGFFLFLIVNYFVTAPPVKRVPAVALKHPAVTKVLHLKDGDITGVYNADHSVKVYAGIPYAAPPIGDLRFREPQPVEKWTDTLACDHFGPMAMQPRPAVLIDSLSHLLGYHDYRMQWGDEYREAMSEDCLYLNVFAPSKQNKPLPVIFYIHGGSLTTGQSSYTEYRGEDLAKKGVIFVNFAYRLGVFGYYAAKDLQEESPHHTTGNYGLLDQIAALNWVKENIAVFGGDPDQVTIAGESAGASSAGALCVSPLTKGLFRYCIAESSGIIAKKPFHTYRDFATALKEGATVRKEFGAKKSANLRTLSAQELLKTQSNQSAMTQDGYAIMEPPYQTYEKGNNHEQALLHGFNAKEADAFILDKHATKENYKQLLADEIGAYAKEMARILPAHSHKRDQHFIIDKGGDAKGALATAYSAIWFSYSHHVWNRYLMEQNRPSYEYYFTKTNRSLSNYHAGELPYAYGNLWRHPGLYTKSDEKLSEIMQNYWTNFAKTGNPNGKGLPNWPMRHSGQTELLQLDTTIKTVPDPNEALYKIIDAYQDSLTTSKP
ncbi:MAG: carboxylesterase family protein [Lachnospiraceae bacterium]|jgi:para-nitrobenzyl esterase|nr:carboxylesterase family protein [Lachnospiraceae bacterium]